MKIRQKRSPQPDHQDHHPSDVADTAPLHSLLQRQIQRHLGAVERIPPEIQPLLQAINDTYLAFDRDRGRLEQSLASNSQELIQANSDVRAVLQAFPDLFFWLDENDVIVDCRAGDPSDLYLALDEPIGRRIQDIPVPDVAAKFSQAVRQVRETRQLVSIEYSLPVDEAHRYYEARLLPMLGNKIIAIVRSITDRKRAEEALFSSEKDLRESHERYRIAAETTGQMIYDYHVPTGTITWAGKIEAITGFSPREFAAVDILKWADMIHPEDRNEALRQLEDAMKDLSPYDVECRFRRKDGHYIYVEVYGNFLPEATGRTVRMIGAMKDVTERKRAEDQLRHSEEQLRQSQKMEAVGRLAGGIAHDFNNLLTSILGFGRLALDRVDDPEIRADIDEVMRAGDRAARLTSQLLAFSRKEVGRVGRLDLNRIVTDMERLLHRTLGENITLATIPGEDLGSVEADRGQIEQVILNLAINARDAMPDGGNLTIETSRTTVCPGERRLLDSPAREYVLLTVRDTGRGMSPEVCERAFEPFFTSKKEGRGTGLGLAVVYGIVHQCGGWIDLFSVPGRGTEFRVYLPRTAAPPDAADWLEEADVVRGTETVLLVEDEDSVRHLSMRMLTSLGYTVLEARNGVDALHLSQEYQGPIHLVFTDVVMPMMGGPELARQLRAARNGVRVLYCTGFTDRRLFGPSVPDPERQVIFKPYTREVLAQRVRAALDGS